MKPTQEIIDIATQLHKLGVKKDPEIGDWFIPEDPNDRWCCLVNNENDKHHISFLGHIVIPPLEWGLEWLREHKDVHEAKLEIFENGWDIELEINGGDNKERGEMITVYIKPQCPHLAVLKAIIAVAKEKQ